MRIIAHVDMNSYFASVEQQANPSLRGKALGVCAYLHEHGCVIAASIEAKRQGMKVGMTLKEARETVPGARFVQVDPTKYRSVTKRLFKMFRDTTDKMLPYSIDEAFLDLTGWCRDEAEAAFILARIKERIHHEIGDWLMCSIGIAPSYFLAKLASERKKPNGLTIITLDNLDATLAEMQLEDIAGIAKGMRRQFWRAGLFTPLDVKHANPMAILRRFGKPGYLLWMSLQGEDCPQIYDLPEQPKTIGHSYQVPDRVNQEGKVGSTAARLLSRACDRLRARELLAGGVSLVIGFRDDEDSRFDSVQLNPPTDDQPRLQQVVATMLARLWHGERVSFLAVTLIDLGPPSRQVALPRLEQRRSVSSWIAWRDTTGGLERVRRKYGESSLFLGFEWSALRDNHAPDRIGFRKIEGPGYDTA
ncbi:MAG: DNA polymerase IV [Patescibacteria group bacterium]